MVSDGERSDLPQGTTFPNDNPGEGHLMLRFIFAFLFMASATIVRAQEDGGSFRPNVPLDEDIVSTEASGHNENWRFA